MTSVDVTFCIIWHLTRSQYGCYRLKPVICRLQILDFIKFNANSWTFMTKTGVSMYFCACIWAAGLLFGTFPWFYQRLSVLTGSTETGCGRLAVVQPPIVQSVPKLVWDGPRSKSKRNSWYLLYFFCYMQKKPNGQSSVILTLPRWFWPFWGDFWVYSVYPVGLEIVHPRWYSVYSEIMKVQYKLFKNWV